jgi:hypothetical protein
MRSTTRRVVAVLLAGCGVLLAGCGVLVGAPMASAASSLPPIKHVFVIVEENESAATTFGAGSPAPYLSQTLSSEGAYLSQYYGVGHSSLDNYVAMVSGQAPNSDTSADCGTFADFPAGDGLDASGQQTGEGCVYPTDVLTLMQQLDGAGLTWRGYMDEMGADPARESSTCGHPAVGSADNTETAESAAPFDQYATRHDPFVYFHYVADNAAECSANVVNLSQLTTDLHSAATTPNYVFITPDLCNDGHNTNCSNGDPGGLPQADTFLKTLVPEITSSPAYQQNGLLIITFDESVGDDSACCGETPGPGEALPGAGGPGGGVVGAVLLSPYIKTGTTTSTPYNHYSMLGSVEDIFGLPRLGEAAGTTAFGSDIFTNYSSGTGAGSGTGSGSGSGSGTGTTPTTPTSPRVSGLRLRPGALKLGTKKHAATISYRDSLAAKTTFRVVELLAGYRRGHRGCRAIRAHHKRPAHTARCTATKDLGSFTHSDTAGPNRVTFNGKLNGRRLAAGAYELVATPTLSGTSGAPVTVHFRISR